MRLRYLALAILLLYAAPAMAQSCIPPNYSCGNSTRTVVADPTYNAPIGVAGSLFASQDTLTTSPALTILRVTDLNTCPATPSLQYFFSYSAEANVFNSDSSRFWIENSDGPWMVYTLNVSMGAAARSPYAAGIGRTNHCEGASPTYLELLSVSADPAWGFTAGNKDKLFVQRAVGGQGTISSTDLTLGASAVWTNIKTLSACTGLPASGGTTTQGLSLSGDDAYIAWAGFGTPNDNADNWQWVVVVRLSDGKCRGFNMNATTNNIVDYDGTVSTATYIGGTVSGKIHNVRIDRTGKYVYISPVSSQGRIVWEFATGNVDTTSTGVSPYFANGHWALGYTHGVSTGACHTGDCREAWYTTLGTNTYAEKFSPAFSGGIGTNGDCYYSGNNANAGDTNPLILSCYVPNTGQSATPAVFRKEIVAVNPANGTFRRLLKTCSSDNVFEAQTRSVVSPDGLVFSFASNWAACAQPMGRYDAFILFAATNAPPAPTLSSLGTTSGTYLGGTSVTAAGTGFVSGAVLYFDGLLASSCVFNSSISLTCNTPGHAAGAVDVVVTNPDTLSATLPASYTYTGTGAPTISSLTSSETGAARGSSFGGYNLTIAGTNFAQGLTVTIGGAGVAIVSVNTTQIVCVVPTRSVPGAVDVVVTNPNAQTVTSSGGFTYSKPVIGRP